MVGRDIRLSSKELTDAVAKGVTEAGAEVMDIGLGGTEMVYFATSFLEADGGIMVTASHNPADYNGLKIVREEARPVSADSNLVGQLVNSRKAMSGRKRLIGAGARDRACAGRISITF